MATYEFNQGNEQEYTEEKDCRSFKQKATEFGNKAKDVAVGGVVWVATHPIETAIIVGVSATALRQGRLAISKAVELHKDKVDRLTVYCNDVCGRVKLKHELGYRELKELRERMNDGQTKFEALDDMGLIK